MSSPLRSGLTAAMAAVYVAATAGVLFWGVDLAIVAGVEHVLEALSLAPSAWAADPDQWNMSIALVLAVAMAGVVGGMLGRRAYRVERTMSDA